MVVFAAMVGWVGDAGATCGQGYLMGRSKVILSRDDLFSVKARHRHLEWREFFFVYTVGLGLSFFGF